MKKDIRTTTIYHPCNDLGDDVGKIQAYVNSTGNEVYIQISYDTQLAGYSVLNADTAEALGRELIRCAKEIRKEQQGG